MQNIKITAKNFTAIYAAARKAVHSNCVPSTDNTIHVYRGLNSQPAERYAIDWSRTTGYTFRLI